MPLLAVRRPCCSAPHWAENIIVYTVRPLRLADLHRYNTIAEHPMTLTQQHHVYGLPEAAQDVVR
jgi:hypothetical protein